MNIFDEITKDHNIQRELLNKLVATSGDTDERQRLFLNLKKELEIHADAEERHFYVPLIEIDNTQQLARHGVAEHHEIDELVEKLEETENDSSAWLTYAKQLKDKVEHHLEDEEQDFFQKAGIALNDTEKENLAKDYAQLMEERR